MEHSFEDLAITVNPLINRKEIEEPVI